MAAARRIVPSTSSAAVGSSGSHGSSPTPARIRVFQQTTRWGETSWVLWLYEHDYAVILWERRDFYLLKTAFHPMWRRKKEEFERDWKAFQAGNG